MEKLGQVEKVIKLFFCFVFLNSTHVLSTAQLCSALFNI